MLTVTSAGTGSGTIKGTMAFDRKDYGMNSGIPFIRIADRVEVTVDLKVKRVGGPPVAEAIAILPEDCQPPGEGLGMRPVASTTRVHSRRDCGK